MSDERMDLEAMRMNENPPTVITRLCLDDGWIRHGPLHHGTDYPCTGSHHTSDGWLYKCDNPIHLVKGWLDA